MANYKKRVDIQTNSRDAYLRAHREEIEEATLKQLDKVKVNENSKQQLLANPTGKVMKTGYFSQQNVKQYQNEMATHLFGATAPKKRGRGAFFNTPDELNEWLVGYFDLCARTEVVPTVAALCCWLKCDNQTLLNHAHNLNSEFHESCAAALSFCHASLENGATENKLNSVAYIFQAKNYFGMKDVQQVQVGTSDNASELNSAETLNALKEQKEKELKGTPLQIDMREAKIIEPDENVKMSNE